MTQNDEKLLDQKFGRVHDKLDLLLNLEDRVKDLEKNKLMFKGFTFSLTFIVTVLTIITLIDKIFSI